MPGSRASICISPFYGSAAMVAKRTLDELRVLIIEDDADFAAQLRIMLERSAGIRRIECCETLLCALTRLHAEPDDLAFLDLHLPDSEDLETLHRVRALYPALPIVVMTAREDDDLGDAAIRIGAQDYVVKHRLCAEILPRLLRNALTRARLEEALRRSEQRGRALFEHGLGLLCAHDLEGRLLDINPAAAHALGFRPEALVGRLLAELMPDAMRPRLKDYLRRIRRAGEAEGVFPVLTRGGEQRRWQFRNRLLTAEPEPYVLGFAIDVTDHIAAAERLGEQHAELAAIQQVLPLGLVRLDPMGAALDANPAFARIMGRPLAELLGDGWSVALHPEDRSRVVESWAAVVRAGARSFASQHRVQRPDGEVRWVSAHADAFFVGAELRGYVASLEDITERHLAQQSLAASARRLSTITDAMPMMIGYSDRDECFVYVNRAYERFYGLPRERIVGRTVRDVLGETRYLRRKPYLTRALAGQSVRFEDADTSSGEELVLEVSYIPDVNEEGGVDGIHILVQDISAQRRETRQLRTHAETDALTGLLNRAGLLDRLGRALARSADQQTLLAVYYLDLDGFKGINDRMGHAVGDAVLYAVAKRLTAAVRASDVVARLGGDEFVILAEGLREPVQARVLAEKIVVSLRDPIACGTHAITATASVGVALGDGVAASPESMLMRADVMLYAAKRDGRDGYRIAALGEPLVGDGVPGD